MSSENSINFHISNGGVSFGVEDTASGPLVQVSATHFGHPTGGVGVFVKASGLRALAEFFAAQADRQFAAEYCCAAETPGERVASEAGQTDAATSVSGVGA